MGFKASINIKSKLMFTVNSSIQVLTVLKIPEGNLS